MKSDLKHLLTVLYELETEILGDKELSLIIEGETSGKRVNYDNPNNAEYLNFKEAADLIIATITLIIALLTYFNIHPHERRSPTLEETIEKDFGKYWKDLDDKGKMELIKFFKENGQDTTT